jgi:hypothetical protein
MYDFCNRSQLNFLIYEENFVFFFISVLYRQNRVAFGIEAVHKIPLTVLSGHLNFGGMTRLIRPGIIIWRPGKFLF